MIDLDAWRRAWARMMPRLAGSPAEPLMLIVVILGAGLILLGIGARVWR